MDSAFGFELEEIARLTQQPLLPAIARQLLKQVRSRADIAVQVGLEVVFQIFS